jgi:LL-diaminopimelate aminotransferase
VEKKKRVVISASERVSQLPPYLFAEIDRQKKLALEKGINLIDFGIGDPDLPTSDEIIQTAEKAVRNPEYHRYPEVAGSTFFKKAIESWMDREFGVKFNENISCTAVIGSKEGLAHIPMVFCNPGELVLIPNPGYPVYRAAAILANAVPIDVPLLEKNGYVPMVNNLEASIRKQAKVLYVNYPNNPTGAVLSHEQMVEIVAFARREDVLIVSDNSYSHIRFDGKAPTSFLQIEGADDVCLEFHSLSKTFNMTGWRIGFVVGGNHLVKTFLGAKENIDSGVFTAIQKAAETALTTRSEIIQKRMEIYSERRRVLLEGLEQQKWKVSPSPGTFYVWMKVPTGYNSMSFTKKLISKAGIVVTPGSGFGTYGEGYIRFALTISSQKISEAIGRFELLVMPRKKMGRRIRKDQADKS